VRGEGEWLVVRLSGLGVGNGFTVYASGFRVQGLELCKFGLVTLCH
jgi:hypothetical protein